MDSLSDLPADFETVLAAPSTYQPFRLLDLPDELWLHILTLSLTRTYYIDPTWAPANKQQAIIVAQPAITRTCRVLRTEGLPLFYSLNTFQSQHTSNVACTKDWLIAIGEANRRAMGTLYFDCECGRGFWIPLFAKCGIKAMILEVDEDSKEAMQMAGRSRLGPMRETLAITFL